ncbi:MAG: GNAT family N-acetyltransferase [Rhizobiaceae bacterium]|nr:GNAT family N-acetyltransferase [Rhizobiaceae bacterium]MCV0404712.1 GNAT family N-acetyltransferase [Rhizobiaceae bacterium]
MRRFRAGDAGPLAELETRAAAVFSEYGYPGIAAEPARTEIAFEALGFGGVILVAETQSGIPAGFAAAGDEGGVFWLREMSVDPGHRRNGLGSALLNAILEEAGRHSCRAVALSTFRDLPFNAPFYARHGFKIADEEGVPAMLRTRMQTEMPPGVDPQTRVLMMRHL